MSRRCTVCRVVVPRRGGLPGRCVRCRDAAPKFAAQSICNLLRRTPTEPTPMVRPDAVVNAPHDFDVPTPFDLLAHAQEEALVVEVVSEAMARRPRNVAIAVLRFGADLELAEIAEMIGVTRQRVQQIESAACREIERSYARRGHA